MDLMESPTIRRLILDAKRNAPLLVFGTLALLIILSTAVALALTGSPPGRDAGRIAAASPSSRLEPTRSISPAPSPAINPVPAVPAPVAAPDAAPPTPKPTPRPTDDRIHEVDTDPVDVEDPSYYEGPIVEPRVSIQLGGQPGDAGFWIGTGDTVEEVLHLQTQDLVRSDCSLIQSYEPDDPTATPWMRALEPLPEQSIAMADGQHTFVAVCDSEAGELTATVRGTAMDGTQEACRGFEFVRGEISVSSYEELTAGVVGTWAGCVTTPWTPMYIVTVTLREDGTYSATTDEVLDGNRMVAFYYGTDADDPSKLYAINDFQDSGLGLGQLDITFGLGPEPGVRGSLRNVRLMGDLLEFEVFHVDEYGPITFQLYRQ
jgi:hypothetical protein